MVTPPVWTSGTRSLAEREELLPLPPQLEWTPGGAGPGPGSRPPSGREGGHLQGDPLPQLLGLFPSLQILQHVIKLHHSHRRQAEGAPSAADDVHKVIVVGRGQVDEPVVDVLWRSRETSAS